MAYTTIDDPSAYFQTVLWTGNGSTQSITFGGNSDMQPDWLWTKCRSDTFDPIMRDTSRGIANRLLVHATDAEGGATGTTAFNSDGFSLDSTNTVNNNTDTYVAWGWKANGGTESGSFGEAGTNPAVSFQANTTAGFSICTYTGTGGNGSFAHGLGVIPAMFIIKRRSGAEDWAVYHHKNTSAPETDYLLLNTTDATADSDTRFQDTAPTSSSIYIGTNAVVNADASTYVCYAFAEIQGYSKFGSFEGNNNTDGPFVYTGFKPAWVMIKNIDTTGKVWFIWDNARDTYNVANHTVEANANSAEGNTGTGATNYIDMLSNGFKVRQTGSHLNPDGDTVIYMAFAESPFVSSEGVPTTAR